MKKSRISLQGDRLNNQDRVAIWSENRCHLSVMADGLGGHPRGEVAAQLLLEACHECFVQCPKPVISPRLFFHQCSVRATEAIHRYMQTEQLTDSPRTTAMLVLVQEGQCYWSHSGDSRFYLIRNGQIHFRSTDHTLETQYRELAGTLKGRILTRCIGGNNNPPLTTPDSSIALLSGDILLSCSDGLWAQLAEGQMLEILSRCENLEDAVEMLGSTARNNFASYSDNVSAVALQVEDADLEPDTPPASAQEPDLLSAIDQLDALIHSKIHL